MATSEKALDAIEATEASFWNSLIDKDWLVGLWGSFLNRRCFSVILQGDSKLLDEGKRLLTGVF